MPPYRPKNLFDKPLADRHPHRGARVSNSSGYPPPTRPLFEDAGWFMESRDHPQRAVLQMRDQVMGNAAHKKPLVHPPLADDQCAVTAIPEFFCDGFADIELGRLDFDFQFIFVYFILFEFAQGVIHEIFNTLPVRLFNHTADQFFILRSLDGRYIDPAAVP
jgi:hypothetical protein